MAGDTDPTADAFRDDLVAYLAKRLGLPNDVALSALGDWLLDFERTHLLSDRARRRRCSGEQ